MRKGERNEKTRGDKKREQMERGWTKRGNKEVKKTFWKGSMLRRRSRNIKQKTTWKTDERKTWKEKGTDKHKTWSFSDRVCVEKSEEFKKGFKKVEQIIILQFFLRRKKQERERNNAQQQGNRQTSFFFLQQFHKLVFQRGYGQKTKGKGKHMC